MMKKTLIATAVASAFSLNAFAADVSINGYLGAGFELGGTDAAGTEVDGKQMANAANNMLIINVSDALDNGMTAYGSFGYTLYNNAMGSADQRFTRIGLKGDFGDAAWGMGEMIYEVGQIFDGNSVDYNGGGNNTELSHTKLANGLFNFTRLDENVFIYSMNQIGVIKPTILYGFGNSTETTGDTSGAAGLTDAETIGVTNDREYDDGMMQLALDYDNGAGLNAQFAYAAYTDVSPTSTISLTDAQPAGAADATGMRLTVRYDMGGIKLGGTYQMLELDSEQDMDLTGTNYDGNVIERDTMTLNIVVPTATGRVMIAYGSSDDASVDGVSLAESGMTNYSIGYYYDLSSNVLLGARFGKESEDQNYDVANNVEDSATTKAIFMRFLF
jgi:hypothetical protein